MKVNDIETIITGSNNSMCMFKYISYLHMYTRRGSEWFVDTMLKSTLGCDGGIFLNKRSLSVKLLQVSCNAL